MKNKALLGILGVLGLSLLVGTTWNSSYEAVPGGSDLASDLDTFINGFKQEVRQRLEAEHIFGGSTDDNGLHTLGSARCFQQTTAPTDISGGTAARGQYVSSTGSDGGTALTTEEAGASTTDIGAGRCWIDTDGPDNTANTPDDYSVAVWNETTNSFVYLGSIDGTAGTQRFMFDPGKANLVYNGQFETTDGTGSLTSTADALGWTDQGTVTVGYVASTAAQGDGVMLRLTAAGSANEGLTQTLKGLKGSTTYYVVARALPGVALDSCTLRTTGASTNATSTIAAGTSWVTLSSFFVTDATPTDVVLILEADVDGDICNFDLVGVYETSSDRRGVPDPKLQIASTTNSTDDPVDTTESIVQDASGNWVQAVTVPRPGYSILVLLELTMLNTGGNCPAGVVNLQEDIDGGGFTDVRTVAFHVDGQADNGGAVLVHWVRANPNAGSKYSYQSTMDCDQGSATVNADNANTDAGHDTNSQFSVLLIPTG